MVRAQIIDHTDSNTDTGLTNCGYVKLTTTGPDGFPTTIDQYSYDRSGAAITVQ